MKPLTIALLAMAFGCSAMALNQQQTQTPSNPTQNSQDVPQQTPGSNNPDLQQQRKPAPKSEKKTEPSTPSQHAQDVPHQQPGSKNPDLKQQREPAPGATTSTGSSTSKKHSKRGNSKSSTSQTQTGTQS